MRQASTFSGFCQQHDSRLFSALENTPLITDTKENAFLMFMRSLFFENHQKRWAQKKMIKFKNLCQQNEILLTDENFFDLYIEGKDQFINIDFPWYSTQIYSFHQSKDYRNIRSIYIKLAKKSPIAVTTMISPFFDDYDKYNNRQALFSFNIIPYPKSSIVALSWFEEDDDQMINIIDLAKKDTNKLINYLAFMETENYYISHEFYNKHILKEKKYIIDALHNRSIELGYDESKILYNFIDNNTEVHVNNS